MMMDHWEKISEKNQKETARMGVVHNPGALLIETKIQNLKSKKKELLYTFLPDWERFFFPDSIHNKRGELLFRAERIKETRRGFSFFLM
jgi:hypothetical protein